MANTPNNDIPYAPENVTDPAAAINQAVDKIDGPLQLMVLGIQDSPPSESADGDRYIVDTGIGEWAGEDDRIARYIEDGDYWDFFDAHIALNQADGLLYINIGDSNGWQLYNSGSGGGTVDKVQPELTASATVPAPDNTTRELIQPTDSTGGAITLTPDANGWVDGDLLEVVDSVGSSWSVNAVTVDFGTHNYHSAASQTEVLSSGGTRRFRYVNSTIGFTDGT